MTDPLACNDAAAKIAGAFRKEIAVLGSDEAKRLDREEELNAEEHGRYRGGSTTEAE